MESSFDWMTREIRIVWWASREELVPLEDMSELSGPRAIIEKKLGDRFQKPR